MFGLLRDRTLLTSLGIVLLALLYVACASGRDPVVPTGCVSDGDCFLDGFPEGTSCLGGYCIPPDVERECTTVRMCIEAGFPSGTTCEGGFCSPPPVDAGQEVDAGGDDAAVSGAI